MAPTARAFTCCSRLTTWASASRDVVLASVTSRDALAHVVRRLQQVKARAVGAILNRADLSSQSYYYGYSYKRYYGDDDKPEAPPAASPEPRRDRTVRA